MLIPKIRSRMKQSREFLAHRVEAGNVGALVAVAPHARQCKVFERRFAYYREAEDTLRSGLCFTVVKIGFFIGF
jgi:hypothetical protein